MKKSKLEQLYAKFLLLPFPLSEGHEKATQWIASLSEVDGYYAGIAESLIMQKPIEIKELPTLKTLSSMLKKLQKDEGVSEEKFQEYKNYLSGLDKLAKEIAKVVKVPEVKV